MNTITKDGQDWLIATADPFHDFSRSIEGAPDETLSRSYVRVHNQTFTINAVAEDDNLELMFTGFHGYYKSASTYFTSNTTLVAAPTVEAAPVMTFRSTSANTPTLTATYGGDATMLGLYGTIPDATNAAVPSRLMAIGFEVRDVTPELYKKGTLSACMSSIDNSTPIATFATDAETFTVPFITSSALPVSLSNIMMHTQSYQNELRRGCYAIPRLDFIAKPQRCTAAHGANVYNSICCVQESDGSTLYEYFTQGTNNTLETQDTNVRMFQSGFAPIVLRMTGVAIQTSLRISLRTIVEYFPDTYNASTLPTATDSPIFDPHAIAAYHRIVRCVPFCVPVSENSAGDYFRKVLNVARKVAPYALDAAGFVAPAALAAMGAPTMIGPTQALLSAARSAVIMGNKVLDERERARRKPRAAQGGSRPKLRGRKR